MMNRVSKALNDTLPSLKSIAKMLLLSKCVHAPKPTDASKPIIILGNGPSLRDTIEQYGSALADATTMAVNFAANAPEFASLKPDYYILVDPHFFVNTADANVAKLWTNIASASWRMTLIVPSKEAKRLPAAIASNPNISIAKVNPVGVEGWQWLENVAYGKGWGMPRPRNVLIPAIMAAIIMGYKQIYVAGADHSWLKTLSVDEENHVVSIQPHFYKEDDKELKRIRTDYLQYPLHQILESFTIAFRSYHRLQRYAASHGIQVINSTTGSFIDAFPRARIPL